MKATIKWIDGKWNAFITAEGSCRELSYRSAGIADTVEWVESKLPYKYIGWTVVNNSLRAAQSSEIKKISKSD